VSRIRIVGIAGCLALIALAIALTSPAGAGEGSSLSLRPRGWYAARRYLEGRGVAVRLLDAPLDAAPPSDVLVLVFPFRRELLSAEADALSQRVVNGGLLLLALTDDRLQRPDRRSAQDEVLHAFGLTSSPLRRRPPLAPARWRAWASEEWVLQPAPSAGGGPGAELATAAPLRLPEVPAGARILHRGPEDQPVVFRFTRGRGQVLVMPADVLSNRRIAQARNLDWLEGLAAAHPGAWSFDEFHHGLAREEAAAPAGNVRALDMFLVHLALVYGLAVASVARRFGPAWSDPPVRLGSTASFLLGVAARHHASRHHAPAAQAVLRRARELEPRLRIAPQLERRAQRGAPDDLLAVARAVARAFKPKERSDA